MSCIDLYFYICVYIYVFSAHNYYDHTNQSSGERGRWKKMLGFSKDKWKFLCHWTNQYYIGKT